AGYELFIDLGAGGHQIEFPVVYTNAKLGTATLDLAKPGTDLRPLLDLLIHHTPVPTFTPGHPLQLLVTNLSANDYVGRMAVGRIWNGAIRMGQRVTVIREEADDTAGSVEPGRQTVLTGTVTSLTTAHGIERVDIACRIVGGARPRRALARGTDRADAPRGVRNAGLAPGGAAPPRRRRAPGAIRANHDRHSARVHRRRPDGALEPQGAPRADDH